MPPSKGLAKLRSDPDLCVLSGVCSSTLATRHGCTAEVVLRERGDAARAEMRSLAMRFADLRSLDLSTSATTLYVLREAVARETGMLAMIDAEAMVIARAIDAAAELHRAAMAAQALVARKNVDPCRSAGGGQEWLAGAPRSASGDSRELGARGRPVREDGLGAGVVGDVGRLPHQMAEAPARRARGSGSDG